MALTTAVPTEDFESRRFSAWLRAANIRHTHIANENSSRRAGVRNKSMGLSKGVPDYLIVTSKLVFVELKRQRGGRISKEQRDWLSALNNIGICAAVCNGFQEARQFVEANL